MALQHCRGTYGLHFEIGHAAELGQNVYRSGDMLIADDLGKDALRLLADQLIVAQLGRALVR